MVITAGIMHRRVSHPELQPQHASQPVVLPQIVSQEEQLHRRVSRRQDLHLLSHQHQTIHLQWDHHVPEAAEVTAVAAAVVPEAIVAEVPGEAAVEAGDAS